MKSLKYLIFISIISSSLPSFAAQPHLQFELNPDGKSFTLRIDNRTENTIDCTSFEITADIGNQDCSSYSPDFNQTISNLKIPKGGSLIDSNFGKDHLFLVNRKLKPEEVKAFCGRPEVKINCQ